MKRKYDSQKIRIKVLMTGFYDFGRLSHPGIRENRDLATVKLSLILAKAVIIL